MCKDICKWQWLKYYRYGKLGIIKYSFVKNALKILLKLEKFQNIVLHGE